jgi:hypothetical protein
MRVVGAEVFDRARGEGAEAPFLAIGLILGTRPRRLEMAHLGHMQAAQLGLPMRAKRKC